MKEVIDNIKDLRIKIDALIVKTQKNYFPETSREISLAYTNLQRGKMWLGKVLGELNTPSPYPQSDNPSDKTIEPQAEHNIEADGDESVEFDQIVRVKDVRRRIQVVVDKMKEFTLSPQPAIIFDKPDKGAFYSNYIMTAILAMEEAKMWYGWELDRIRTKEDNKDNPR